MESMSRNRAYWADVQAEAIWQMVQNGEAEEKIVRVGSRKKRIYKIKPYVPED